MECYKGFAYLYDQLMMTDINYDQWANYIEDLFNKYKIEPKLILELACGTGNICTRLAQRGYDMIGIDLSVDMLNVAMSKKEELSLDILYLCQDMCDFELYGTVDAILCCMDSVNYITEIDQLLKMFKLVNNYLNPGGLFIFDINTKHKLKNIIGNNVFTVDEEDIFYVWDNSYDEENEICNFYLTFFVKEGKYYNRIDEIHQEKAYTISDIKYYLERANLAFLDAYDEFTFNAPDEKSERVFIIAKKNI